MLRKRSFSLEISTRSSEKRTLARWGYVGPKVAACRIASKLLLGGRA